MATTRLGPAGYMTQPVGSFAGKPLTEVIRIVDLRNITALQSIMAGTTAQASELSNVSALNSQLQNLSAEPGG